jgi:hypothetical protein
MLITIYKKKTISMIRNVAHTLHQGRKLYKWEYSRLWNHECWMGSWGCGAEKAKNLGNSKDGC